MGSKGKSKQKRGSYWRGSRIALTLIALALIVTVTIVVVIYAGGGTGEKSATAEVISPKWIDAELLEIGSDTVSIPTNEVVSVRMLHFAVSTGQGVKENFMAYNLAGETHVRANVCPPCRSIGFSLVGDVLVCDSCGTRFNANTGDGISGACKDFPKAAVAYTISGDNIAMGFDDLVAAYENTEKPGWP